MTSPSSICLSRDNNKNTSSEIDFSELSLNLEDDTFNEIVSKHTPGYVEIDSNSCNESSFCLKSNLSENSGNVSISYSVSLNESKVEQSPAYNVNNKRRIKNCPKMSASSMSRPSYSPLATDLLINNSRRHKRISDVFRETMLKIDLSIPKEVFSPDSFSDKDLSFMKNLSINSEKENLSKLSIDENIQTVEAKEIKSTRFSEHFRAELSHLNISSPDISFDMPNTSPKQSTDLSLEMSSNHSNSPAISNSTSYFEDLRNRKESDDDDDVLHFNKPVNSWQKANVLESSDEESDVNEASFNEASHKTQGSQCSINLNNTESEDDDQYENSFIDDEASEGEETASESSCSESSSDEFIHPHMTTKKNIFSTPKASKNLALEYKTPDVQRRRTCVATPLSVNTKTGTPGIPNRTYSRNFLTAAQELFKQFNENVFSSQLPDDLEIKINKRLNTTAGRCVYIRKGTLHKSFIELSPKVVDCLERLKETLAHELCHAAAFIIDEKMDNHGPIWRKWATRVNTKYPELPPVSRCHSYEIQYKHNYKCSEEWCKYKIGRHSKSIDLNRALCPLCFSKLVLIDSGKLSAKTPNRWTEFVKSKYNDVKDDQPPKTPHKDIMKILSLEFKQIKGTV